MRSENHKISDKLVAYLTISYKFTPPLTTKKAGNYICKKPTFLEHGLSRYLATSQLADKVMFFFPSTLTHQGVSAKWWMMLETQFRFRVCVISQTACHIKGSVWNKFQHTRHSCSVSKELGWLKLPLYFISGSILLKGAGYPRWSVERKRNPVRSRLCIVRNIMVGQAS